MRLPDHPERITPPHLTDALRAAGALTGGTVESVRWRSYAEDRGLAGVISRGTIRYDGPPGSAPTTVIAKFPMADRDVESTYSVRRRNDTGRRDHFERSVRELRFYREVAPVAGVSVPELYAGEFDDRSETVAMLMADVRDAEERDLLLGCTPDEAAAVVASMAPLHAWGWDHDGPDWLLRTTPVPLDAIVERYGAYAEPFLAQWGPYLPRGVHDIVRRLATGLADVLVALDNAPATVIHGDLHLDNVLFRRDGDPRVVILDWQGVRRGPVAEDVGGFVLAALTPGARRAHAEGIFTDYLDRLAGYGVTGMSLDQLHRDVRLVSLRRLAGVVNWAMRAESAAIGPRERALVEAQVADDRLASALIDYDVADLLR